MTELVKTEARTTLCSAPLVMLRDTGGVTIEVCTHHIDESPCPHHKPDAPPQTYLTDLSGQRRPPGDWGTFEDGEFMRRLFRL